MRYRVVALIMVAALLPVIGAGSAGALGPCFGKAPTIVIAAPGLVTYGTNQNDVIMGTTGADVIHGLGGNDRICSGLGGDEVHGGNGHDWINAGDGNDWVFGDAGDDYIEGGTGDDTLSGWNGNDDLRGGDGNDELWGGRHNDKIYGQSGKDTIKFSGGNDAVNGGGGKDWFDASGVTKSRAVAGLRIDLAGGVYGGSVGGKGTITKVENVRGTGKADKIFDDPAVTNRLEGGDGDDKIVAGMYDWALGGTGSDTLKSTSWFVTLSGQAGNDKIVGFARGDVQGGIGNDRCTLNLGTTSQDCEKHVLVCGGSSIFPVLPLGSTDVTSASGDFDGNGIDGTLNVYKNGGSWYGRILTDSGYEAISALPTHPADFAEAIGGHDINKDGVDEAFLLTGTGAYTELVTIYALQQPIAPSPGMKCGLVPVKFSGSSADATFPVGASLMNQSGLRCLASGVRGYIQNTGDGTTYQQQRSTYTYTPYFGQSVGYLYLDATKNQTLTRPGDDAKIDSAQDFDCGSLSL